MSRTKFIESFVDKVLIGTIATIVSLFLLFGYNSNLKSFEAGQTQARSVSLLAIKSKDSIATSFGEVLATVRKVYFKADGSPAASATPPTPPTPASSDVEFIRSVVAITAARMSLGPGFPETAKLAAEIEKKFRDEVF